MKNTKNPLYCFLDLETTGFDSKKDSIIEISFILTTQDLKEVQRFDKLVIPYRSELSADVTRITGITQSMLDSEAIGWESIKSEVQDLIGGAVIIGHNIDFDIRFLRENGIELDPNLRIDTHELSRIFLVQEESYALEVLSKKYGFLHGNAHRAMSDVEASLGLFEMLLQKVDRMSLGLKNEFIDFFLIQSDWYAKTLIEASLASGNESFEEEIDSFEGISVDIAKMKQEHSLVRITDTVGSVEWVDSLCKNYAKESLKSLLITPRIRFYPDMKTVPVPEILLDVEKLKVWGQEKRSNNQVAFFLKCLHRHNYGFKDLFAMDLYFMERDYWKEVCLEKDDDPRFLKVLENLSEEGVLCLSPDAYARFSQNDLLKGRKLVVDEAEQTAQGFLNSAVTKYQFLPYLDNDDTTVAAQFFVRNICQEVLEPLIGKRAGPFPEKVLLPKGEAYLQVAEQLKEVGDDEVINALCDFFANPQERQERWIIYYPDSGDIQFFLWERDKWETIKNVFSKSSSVVLHRHIPDSRKMFFQHFLGLENAESIAVPELIKLPELVIPKKLESHKSEAFIPFCEDFVKAVIADKVSVDHWLAVHVSSLETLKKVFDRVHPSYNNSPITIKGEKMAGGAGKLLKQLESVDRAVLFYQKLNAPDLTTHPFKSLAMLKFPFDAGSPLYEALEMDMKQRGGSWWDFWVAPQVQANLSRSISYFPQAETFYFLDSRENSDWGKRILQDLFRK